MDNWLESRGVKIALLACALLLFAVCIASGLSALYMAGQWYYDPNVGDFYESEAVWRITRQRASETASLWRKSVESGRDGEPLFRAYNSNFAYQIENVQDGEVLGGNLLGTLAYREIGLFDVEDVRVRGFVQYPLHVEDEYRSAERAFEALYPHRWTVVIVLGIGFVLLVVVLFLLCVSAGRRRGVEGIVLGPQDRTPIDLHLCVVGSVGALLLNVSFASVYDWRVGLQEYVVAGILLFVCSCLGTATLLTLAVRYKAGGWWRSALVYRILQPVGKALAGLLRSLPLIWQVALGGLGMEAVSLVLVMVTVDYRSLGALMLYGLLHAGLFLAVCYAALGLQRLKTMGERIAAGELGHRPDLHGMPRSFHEHAETLGRVGEGMSAAVAHRLRSERLRTELITNVSHDIKTPLTSIVNYVDLLDRLELGGEAGEYVGVLGRQAARLKKLTEDLVEASKATTGNLEVHLERTGLCELLNQSLAEYAERMETRELEPVVTLPEEELFALADGRHLWRVMDNLLGNVCKYAQPATRVYVDLAERGGRCVVAVKNISQARLNIDADELMERFVRGDGARVSEGSGLGLHIARSLVELQHGQFVLTVDGDLFKADLYLPKAPEPAEQAADIADEDLPEAVWPAGEAGL